MFKKILSCFLCAIMIIPASIMPVSAATDSESWTKFTIEAPEEADIYKISQPEHLAWVLKESKTNDFKDKTIMLMNDLDMGAHLWESISGQISVQEDKSHLRFAGTFEGNDHTIKNLDSNEGGLFGHIDVSHGNTISNVKLEGLNIRGNIVGLVANNVKGNSSGTTIYNISVNGLVNASKKGAIVGTIESTSTLILQNCVSKINGIGLVAASDSSVRLDVINSFYTSDKSINISGTPVLTDMYRYVPVKTTPRGRNVTSIAFYNSANILAPMDSYVITVGTDSEGEKLVTIKDFGVLVANETGIANISVNLTNKNYPGSEINFSFPLNITKAEFTLTFYQQNKTSKIATVGPLIEGAFINVPTAPEVKGMQFMGWASEFSEGALVDLSKIIVDTKLYAVYAMPKVELSFETNGGTVIPSIPDIVVNTIFGDVRVPETTKENNVFAGWFYDSALTKPVKSDDKLTSDFRLYAKWNPAKILVSFESNGGSSHSAIEVPYEGTITTMPKPTKQNATFVGWFTDEGLTLPFDMSTKIVKNITLYAKWIDLYTVSIYPNGGVLNNDLTQQPSVVSVIDIKPNTPFNSIVIPTFTRPGFLLDGWYYDAALTSKMMLTDVINSSKSIYAKWVPAARTVTFNTDGGTTVKSITVNSGEKINLPAAPVKLKSKFLGWFTDSTLKNTFDATKPITENMTVYAKWEVTSTGSSNNNNDNDKEETKNEYATIKYVAGTGGTIDGKATQELEMDEIGEFVTATPNSGYKFSKWSDGIKSATRKEQIQTIKDLTITAEFVAINVGTGTGTGTGSSGTETTPDWNDIPQTGLPGITTSNYKPYNGLPSLSFGAPSNNASNIVSNMGTSNGLGSTTGGNNVFTPEGNILVTPISPMAPAIDSEMSVVPNASNSNLLIALVTFVMAIGAGVAGFIIYKKKRNA